LYQVQFIITQEFVMKFREVVLAVSAALVASFSHANTDLALVVDNSGSMSSNDPNGLRYSAIEYLMNNITQTSVTGAGYIEFASGARLIVPLSPIATSVPQILSYVATKPAANGGTDTADGINLATRQFATNATPGNAAVMVVLTDGGANNQSEAVSAASAAAAKNIKVHTLTLGGTSQERTNNALVAAAGSGRSLVARTPQDLVNLLTGIVTGHYIDSSQAAVITSAQVQRSTSIQQALIISNVLSSLSNTRMSAGPKRIPVGQSGMAGGNSAGSLNVWLNGSSSDVGNNFDESRFSGDVTNAIGGIDYMVNRDLVVGVTLGRDRTKINTQYNDGGITSRATVVAPYMSYQFNDVISADASLGYATGDADVRYYGDVTGNQGFKRNFAALNLNGNWWFNDLQVSGKLSYINAQEKLKAFTDVLSVTTPGSKNRIEQLRLGVQVGYWINGIMPYVSVAAVHDLSAPSVQGINTGSDRDAWTASVGVNFFTHKALTASLSYTTEKGRSNSKNDMWMASLGYRF